MLLSPLLSPVIWYGTRIFLIDSMVLFLCLYCRAHTSHWERIKKLKQQLVLSLMVWDHWELLLDHWFLDLYLIILLVSRIILPNFFWLQGWNQTFYVLMVSCFISSLVSFTITSIKSRCIYSCLHLLLLRFYNLNIHNQCHDFKRICFLITADADQTSFNWRKVFL